MLGLSVKVLYGGGHFVLQFLISSNFLFCPPLHLIPIFFSQHRIQRQGRGGKKREIYVAAFGGHLFYDLFVQGWGAWPPRHPPLDPLLTPSSSSSSNLSFYSLPFLFFFLHSLLFLMVTLFLHFVILPCSFLLILFVLNLPLHYPLLW